VSTTDAAESARAERHWVRIGLAVVGVVLVVQFVGGVVRTAVRPSPSALARVQKCLTERSTHYEAVTDPVAESAGRGALRTAVDGNGVTIAIGSSERDARRVHDDYIAVMSAADAGSLLDVHRRVVFLWAQAPTQSERDFAYLCTLDVQD
jgi:hypothetical protein